jgi:Uma2 family endonuclease
MNLVLEGLTFPVRLLPEVPMSDYDLLRLSSANKGIRIEREPTGELVLMTPTGSRTGKKNFHLTTVFGLWAERDDRGYGFDSNTGFTLPDGSMRSPDVSWVEKSRWDALTEEQQDVYSPICPQFVIELRSKSDPLSALQAKMRMWVGNGAELAWLIDPERKVVEVYRPGREVEMLEGGSVVEGEGPVAGFVLELGRIWS